MTTTKMKSTLYVKFLFLILLSSELVSYVQLETEIPLLSDDQGNCWQIKYLKNNSHANKTEINNKDNELTMTRWRWRWRWRQKKIAETYKTVTET